MAYFSRNGFVPVRESYAKAVPVFPAGNAHVPVSVKDVKYARIDTKGIVSDAATNSRDLEKVMTYAKCLIRNLLQLSQHEYIECDSFREFVATWYQFIRWDVFRRSADGFPYYELIVDLNSKLLELMKAHQGSGLIELVLSRKLCDQLEDTLAEMRQLRNIRFSDIRF